MTLRNGDSTGSASSYTSSGNSVTIVPNYSLSSGVMYTISNAAYNGTITSGGSGVLKWTFSFDYNGQTFTTYRYTVLYQQGFTVTCEVWSMGDSHGAKARATVKGVQSGTAKSNTETDGNQDVSDSASATLRLPKQWYAQSLIASWADVPGFPSARKKRM